MQDLGHVQIESPTHRPEDQVGLVLLQVTDLHQWPAGKKEFTARGRVIDFDKEGYSSERNLELLQHAIHESTPDVVLFTGDIVDGRPCKDMDAKSFLEVMRQVLQPVLEAGTAWTYIPGNHDDDESPWTREELLEIYNIEGCLSKGATSFDHTLTVGRGTEPDEVSTVRLWLFDSGTNSPDQSIRYTTFSKEAVEGYKTLSQSGTLGLCAESLAYFHIPLPEYAGLKPLTGKNGLFHAAVLGGKVPFPFSHPPFSSLVKLLGQDRVVGSSKLNSGLFEAFKKEGNVLACFCGHDHHSDFVGRRNGIYLVYGRCGSFTPPSDWEGAGGDLPFDRGARVVHVKGRDQVFTWNCTFSNPAEDFFHLKR